MSLSTFDVFKIGIGPSSSHTMGPMNAAREFATRLAAAGLLERTREVVIRLYGSLALTGGGHGTDRAVLLGLTGADPRTVDPDTMEPTLRRIRDSGALKLLGRHEIPFDEPMQLLFMRSERPAAAHQWRALHGPRCRGGSVGRGGLLLTGRWFHRAR